MRDKAAIVVGAASGIGRATALVFAEAGARVVCADLDERGAAATAHAAEETGAGAVAVKLDVATSVSVRRLSTRPSSASAASTS